jgi:hypothetical protein
LLAELEAGVDELFEGHGGRALVGGACIVEHVPGASEVVVLVGG